MGLHLNHSDEPLETKEIEENLNIKSKKNLLQETRFSIG